MCIVEHVKQIRLFKKATAIAAQCNLDHSFIIIVKSLNLVWFFYLTIFSFTLDNTKRSLKLKAYYSWSLISLVSIGRDEKYTLSVSNWAGIILISKWMIDLKSYYYIPYFLE
jgi:hypothetical protein